MICSTPDCDNWTEGTTAYCASCNHERRRAERQLNKPLKVTRRIKPQSNKRAIQMRTYMKLRDQFLKVHQICEAPTCNKPATQVHHQMGKENELLLDTNFWVATCSNCHTYFTEHSAEAIKVGYSISRNQKV